MWPQKVCFILEERMCEDPLENGMWGRVIGGIVLQLSFLLTFSIPQIFRVFFFSLTCDLLVVGLILKLILPLL